MSERDDTTNISSTDGKNFGDALAMAADILSSTGMAVPSQPSAEALPPNQSAASEPIHKDGNSGSPTGTPLENIVSLFPVLMQAISGSANLIKPERLDLINALKPYLSESRSGSIDRAIRMANITQAAKSALGILGR